MPVRYVLIKEHAWVEVVVKLSVQRKKVCEFDEKYWIAKFPLIQEMQVLHVHIIIVALIEMI